MCLHPPRLTAARAAVVLVCLLAARSGAAEVKLARHPDYHDGTLVFSYLGDLWTVREDGSQLRRPSATSASPSNAPPASR